MKKSPALTYIDAEKEKTSSEFLRNKLKLINYKTKSEFAKKFNHAHKYFTYHGIELGKIREHSASLIGAGAIASALLMSPPININLSYVPKEISTLGNSKKEDTLVSENQKLVEESLSSVLPKSPRPLTENEESFVELLFKDQTGIKVKGNLEGEHLNTTYGYIGYEQHLQRYPGDDLVTHGAPEITRAGMAPGRGAWGYFANSKSELNSDLIEKEKWYVVVQTLYLPEWNRRHKFLKEWYKHRKVVVINTENGKAVVGDIADSGPAAWTGKHFGGSPEVMNELGGLKYRKGKVLVFFVDDPENKVPLGPVDYGSIDKTAGGVGGGFIPWMNRS